MLKIRFFPQIYALVIAILVCFFYIKVISKLPETNPREMGVSIMSGDFTNHFDAIQFLVNGTSIPKEQASIYVHRLPFYQLSANLVKFLEYDFSKGIKFGWYLQITLYGIALLFFMGAITQIFRKSFLQIGIFSATVFSSPMFAVPLHWNHNVYVLSFFLISLFFFLRIINGKSCLVNDIGLGITSALGSAFKLNSWVPSIAFLSVLFFLYLERKDKIFLRSFLVVCIFLGVMELLISRPSSDPAISSLWIFDIKSFIYEGHSRNINHLTESYIKFNPEIFWDSSLRPGVYTNLSVTSQTLMIFPYNFNVRELLGIPNALALILLYCFNWIFLSAILICIRNSWRIIKKESVKAWELFSLVAIICGLFAHFYFSLFLPFRWVSPPEYILFLLPIILMTTSFELQNELNYSKRWKNITKLILSVYCIFTFLACFKVVINFMNLLK